MDRYAIMHGDCLEVMRGMDAASVDAIVTDPPYGLSFMGKDWDHGVPGVHFWEAALAVAKPGTHLLAFGGTRTFHRLACAIEDAGWEIRDTIMWVYGSGFPKSLDVSKAIDKAAGAEREVVGFQHRGKSVNTSFMSGGNDITAPATDLARKWSGWGTALKPAWEPIIVARKPLAGTVAANVIQHGTGAINVDGCRIVTGQRPIITTWVQEQRRCSSCVADAGSLHRQPTQGTVVSSVQEGASQPTNGRAGSSHAATSKMDTSCYDGTKAGGTCTSLNTGESGKKQTVQYQSGTKSTTSTATSSTTDFPTCDVCGSKITDRYTRGSTPISEKNSQREQRSNANAATAGRWPSNLIHDGSEEVVAGFPEPRWVNGDEHEPGYWHAPAARFFYCAKASKADRDHGNAHPTVKPTALMRYLCRLVTPPGGVVLDPFAGSGSTGKAAMLEGFNFIGIELNAEYVDIARARISNASVVA